MTFEINLNGYGVHAFWVRKKFFKLTLLHPKAAPATRCISYGKTVIDTERKR